MAARSAGLHFVVTELSVKSPAGKPGVMRVRGEWLPPAKAAAKSELHLAISRIVSSGGAGEPRRVRLMDALAFRAAKIRGRPEEFRLPAEKGAGISLGAILRRRP